MFKLIILFTVACAPLLFGCVNSPDEHDENNSNKSSEENVAAVPLGRILTTDDGMTLYTYDPDKGAMCSDGCAIWPPYGYARNDSPSSLATDEKIVLRWYGELKVWTINGNRLHTYSGDKKPGDMKSDGLGGWFVAREPLLDK